MSELTIQQLRKSFGTTVALDDISLTAADGELLTLLGPSGCGKSTTLWSIAGLHRPDGGRIAVGDTVLFDSATGTHIPPEDRNCGVVFQSYAIWSHMTVADNVGYPLKLRRVPRRDRDRRVTEVLELVEMAPYARRYPHELSGGQQQRVALARALAHPPRLLLLDEPFSNLDAKLRARAREWLKRLQRSLGVTTVFVTHDQDEALSMSDTIVVMEGGRIHQVGTPEAIYQEPADLFVADFVGTVNLLPGEVVASAHDHVDVGLDDSPLVLRVACPSGPAPAAGGRVVVAVRPEAVAVHDDASRAGRANVVTAPVVDRSYLGDHYRYSLRLGATTLVAQADRQLGGSHLTVEIPPDRARLFPAEPKAATDATDATDVDLDPAEEASVA